jgi:hypothetical protein
MAKGLERLLAPDDVWQSLFAPLRSDSAAQADTHCRRSRFGKVAHRARCRGAHHEREALARTGQQQCAARKLHISSAEDAIDDVLRPRLEAAGADLTRVHALEGVRACDGEGNSRPTLFSLQYDLDLLGEQITAASQDLTSPKSGDAWGRSSRYWGDSFFGLPRLVIGKPSAILARLFAEHLLDCWARRCGQPLDRRPRA